MSCGGICGKCKGMKVALVGLLVLLNAWKGFLTWPMFFGLIILLWGLSCWMKPSCGCDSGMCMPEMGKKRR